MSDLVKALKDAVESGANHYRTTSRMEDVLIARSAYEAMRTALEIASIQLSKPMTEEEKQAYVEGLYWGEERWTTRI